MGCCSLTREPASRCWPRHGTGRWIWRSTTIRWMRRRWISRLDALTQLALDKGAALGLVSVPRPVTLDARGGLDQHTGGEGTGAGAGQRAGAAAGETGSRTK